MKKDLLFLAIVIVGIGSAIVFSQMAQEGRKGWVFIGVLQIYIAIIGTIEFIQDLKRQKQRRLNREKIIKEYHEIHSERKTI